MTLRISGGEAKGRRLLSPRGLAVRPALARVRTSLFDILGRPCESAEGGRVLEAHVLDLFAGIGAVGIEALSRGAASGVFVEKDPSLCRLIAQNLELAGLSDRGRVIRSDVFAALPALVATNAVFRLVFVDPPYALLDDDQGARRLTSWLDALAETPLVTPQSLFILETRSSRSAPPPHLQGRWGGPLPLERWKLDDTRRYGQTSLSFYRQALPRK